MVVCLVLSAFYSGSESAFVSLTPAQLEHLRKQGGVRSKLVYTLGQQSPTLLTTVLIGNNIMNIVLAVVASNMTIRLGGSRLLGVTTAVLTFSVLLFGEIYPKQLAIRNNEQWAMRAVYPIYISKYLFMPFRLIIQPLIKIFLSNHEESNRFTRDSLLQQIHVATGLKVLRRHTSQLLINTLMFERDTAEMVMTHRIEVLSVSISITPEEALSTIHASHFSRIPVYEEDPERIVGVILLKDLFYLRLDKNIPHTLRQVMYSPLFVTQSMHLDRVFLKMRKAQQHMAIVLDEYGGLAGLLTLEDLFERIYGQLYDEHDTVEREVVSYGDDRSYVITASVPILKLNEQLALNIPADRGMTTLSGYLIRIYGNVPPAYAVVSSPYGSFEILSASKRKIQKVLFRKRRARSLSS